MAELVAKGFTIYCLLIQIDSYLCVFLLFILYSNCR